MFGNPTERKAIKRCLQALYDDNLSKMQRLTDIGFKKVGNWTLKNGSFNHTIVNHLKSKDLLYSFICEKAVLYIGKTTDTLKNRMNGYKNASGTQKTNIRVKRKIIELLEASKSVEIYILLEDINFTYKNYKLSLASGLEDNLIASIKPEWNFIGNNRIKEQAIPSEDEKVILENTIDPQVAIKTCEFKLGETYFKNGYFNFPSKEKDFLPTKATEVIIILGKNSEFITNGNFCFANKQKQLRVFGKEALKQWFHDNYEIGALVRIDILKPNLYHIY